MATVTFRSDFGAQENKVYHYFYFSSVCHQVMMLDAMILVFWKLLLFHSPLSPLSRGSSVVLPFLPLGWHPAYLRLLIFLLTILIPACDSSSLASLVAQMIKNLSAMQETWIWSLGREDPLEKEKAILFQYSCLENPVDRGAWWAAAHGVVKESDTTEELNTSHHHLLGIWPAVAWRWISVPGQRLKSGRGSESTES